MKKTMIILSMAALFICGSIPALAAGNEASPAARAAYVDADNDGVCDNAGSGCAAGRRASFVDADNDGVCDNMGSGCAAGRRASFVDADNDGVCDNMGYGCGRAAGRRAARN